MNQKRARRLRKISRLEQTLSRYTKTGMKKSKDYLRMVDELDGLKRKESNAKAL